MAYLLSNSFTVPGDLVERSNLYRPMGVSTVTMVTGWNE